MIELHTLGTLPNIIKRELCTNEPIKLGFLLYFAILYGKFDALNYTYII